MKKVLLTVTASIIILASNRAMAQQGFGTNTPDKSAAVEIVSTKRGLLIPRISIADLSKAAPVINPAKSLLVYNSNTATGEGYYYWDGAKWTLVMTSNNVKSTTVSAKDNKLTIKPTVTGNATDYTVEVNEANLQLNNLGGTLNTAKITPGTDKQVLVTKMVDGKLTPTFVNASEIIDNGVLAENGLTKTSNKIELGGALSKATTITTTATNTLALAGLTNASTGFDAVTQSILIMGADGVLKKASPKSIIENTIAKNNLTAKTLKGEGITVTAGAVVGTNTSVANALLADVTLGIAEKGIVASKLNSTGATAGDVATADGAGGVSYKNAATSLGKTLTTDGVIVIGANKNATETTKANALLAELQLNIGQDKITADHIATGAITADEIKDGTIETNDIKSTGNSKVLATNTTGTVVWLDQSALNNKDTYTGTAPIVVTEGAANTTGGKSYAISATAANGTTAGIVKQKATNASVTIVNGELDVSTAQIDVAGDVTGKLNATKVEKIQNVAVSATTPTQNQLLAYNGTQWTPTTPNTLINVENGISKETTSNQIQLGGALTKATSITTDATKTLAISGLQKAAAANKVVVAENNTGVLRAVTRVLSQVSTASITVANITDYSDYVQEINISATIPATGDIDVVLPTASVNNNGQVVNVRIANTTETHTGYLNIKVGTTTLTYGALPYQSWVLKSNGTDWVVLGR